MLQQRVWGLATETMCSQSVTVGRSSLQRVFDVSEAFKFNPGESQGCSDFDLSQEKPHAIPNSNKPPDVLEVSTDWRLGENLSIKHKYKGNSGYF